ncbi:hypothetical protein FQN60_000454 [Etheostoma spectabile]|uniref:Secreted protein n=1 Tax=Etheostoma spectabile TaxID=54343 RepID=A0A5J5CVY4_9PERO|nr:hypothetical protein FQN60_000454 [Etheostoma spectabile]
MGLTSVVLCCWYIRSAESWLLTLRYRGHHLLHDGLLLHHDVRLLDHVVGLLLLHRDVGLLLLNRDVGLLLHGLLHRDQCRLSRTASGTPTRRRSPCWSPAPERPRSRSAVESLTTPV